jgi:hypothetical protein
LRDEDLEDERLEVAAVRDLAVEFVVALGWVADECVSGLCVALALLVAGFLAAGFFAAVEAVAESPLELCCCATAAGTSAHVRISAQAALCRASRIREEEVILKKKKPNPLTL